MKKYITKEQLLQDLYLQNKEILNKITKKDKERYNELWETRMKGYFNEIKRMLSHIVYEICSELELKASFADMWSIQNKLDNNLILLERRWRNGQ